MSNIKPNRFYNDPNIGAAFSNLAQLFAPPSAQDTYAYARASAEKEEAERKREAFEYARDPNYDQATADRMGVGAGFYPPSQSYHAVGVKDATDRRGQDMESADRRYDVDVDARTDLTKNAADNERAITTQKMSSSSDWFKQPLSEGQVRPAIPSEVARVYGLADGIRQAEGREKPISAEEQFAQIIRRMSDEEQRKLAQRRYAPTQSQVQGQERLDMRANGMLTDQDLVDGYRGERAPVEAIGPDGRPRFMTPGEAARTGAQPAPRSPSTVINNGTGSDSGKFYEEADKARGKSFNDVADAGAIARRSLIQIDELDRTLADVGTGGLAAMKAFAGSYGLPVGDLSDIQAATALINQLVPAQRAPGSGTMSDGDVALFKQSLPRIVNQPNGNALIIRTIRGIAQYDAQRGDIANRVLDREITPAEGRRLMAGLANPLAAFRQDAGSDGTSSAASAVQPSAGSSFRQNQTGSGQVARPTSDAEFDALPAGALYVDPDDGKTYRK